jgi:hypothetical protein
MKIGFTGTQRGMTPDQKHTVVNLLSRRDGELHHGDCIGGDSDVHSIVESLPYWIVIHPPINPAKRAFRKAHEFREPRDYLVRNKNIVVETERLVATPGEFEEQLRSGTWSTIRHARRLRRSTWIVLPDGSVKCEVYDLEDAH